MPTGQCITDAVETVLSQQRQQHIVNIWGIVVEFPAGAKGFVYSHNCSDHICGLNFIIIIIIITYYLLLIAIEFPTGGRQAK